MSADVGAYAQWAAGLCYSVHPPTEDGQKRPEGVWQEHQMTPADSAQIDRWYANGRSGFGVVCGAVSGNLVMFELEGRAVAEGMHNELAAACDVAGIGDVLRRIGAGYLEQTPSDGLHWLYRVDVPPDVPAGFQLTCSKLAQRPLTAEEQASAKPGVQAKTLIETKAEGGYTILHPSGGSVHETGKPWRLRYGGLDQVVTITLDEHYRLLAVARMFDRMPPPAPPRPEDRPRTPFTSGASRFDDFVSEFNVSHTWAQILTGWTEMHTANGITYWCRPGKDPRAGHSATTNATGTDRLLVFSSSVPGFEHYQGGTRQTTTYDKFSAFVVLNTGRHDQATRTEVWRRMRPSPPSRDEPGGQGEDDLEIMLPERVDWDALWLREAHNEWLVEDVWPLGRQLHIFAGRKTGKSLLSLWMAAQLAIGRDPFTGAHQAPIDVTYLDHEMTEDDLLERVESMGLMPAQLGRLNYYLLPSMPPLDTAAGGSRLMQLVERDGSQAVIIDTLSRVVQGEENSNDTYQNFYAHTGRRLKQAGIGMARLDHEGHEPGRARGASSKADDVDVLWRLEATDGGLALVRKAARIAWVPERVNIASTDDPLSFSTGLPSWPHGTKDKADELDRIGAPVEVTKRQARALLKAGGLEPGRDGLLLKAIQYRKNRARNDLLKLGNHAGNHP